MRSASAVLVVVVALALASSSCAGSFVASEAEPQHWLIFKPEAGSSFDYTALARHFDFRGSYKFFGLLVGTEVDARTLKALYPTARTQALAPYEAADQLWVVECDPKFGSALVTEVARTILSARIPVLDTYRDQSGWVDFVVKGSVVALQKYQQAVFVPVPTSAQVVVPELKESALHQLLSDNVALGTDKKNPIIAKLITDVSQDRIRKTVEHLSSYYTRLSTSRPVWEAQEWIKDQYTHLGLEVSTYPFREGFSENVIAELRGAEDPSKIVIVSGHYDSRSTNISDPTMRAPGADDNGSGTANVLELARVFTESGLKFKHTIRFCSWSGEEQGLVGSRVYAKEMREKDVDIIAVLNSDMLGWTLPNTSITLGMKDRYVYPPLLWLANNLTLLYVPELEIGYSPSCCSDHQSFFEQGYPAVGYFENVGSASDYPHYHKSSDLPENLNFEQVALISRAIAAATATIAVPLV